MADQHEDLEARISALEKVVRQLQTGELKRANQVGRPADAPTRIGSRTPTRTGYPKR